MRERLATFLSMTSTDWPRPFSIDRQLQISSRIRGARPSVASSRMRSFGLVISARPIASICCSPPDSVTPILLPRSASRGNSAWIFSMVQGSELPARLHQADAEFCDFVRRQAAHFLAGEANLAGAGRRHAHDGADGGGLAHTVAAHQGDHLA